MDIASLVVNVDTTDVKEAEKDLKSLSTTGARTEKTFVDSSGRMRDAGGKFAGSTKGIKNNFLGIDKSVLTASRSIGSFTTLLGAIGAVQAVRSIAAINDEYAQIEGRLKLVTDGSEELADIQEKLFKVAQRTSSQYGAVAELYTKVAKSADELGASQEEILKFTELTNQAFQVSGASTAEASGAVRQLSQALQSGVLRGDEFNSINEQGGRIMDALAKGLRVTRGQLRGMAEDGQLTSDVVFPALLSQAEAINSEFEAMPRTISRASTELNNAWEQAIAGSNVQPMIDAIDDLKETITDPAVIEGIATLGGAIIGAFAAAIEKVSQFINVIKFLAESTAAAIHGPAIGDMVRIQDELAEKEAQLQRLREHGSRSIAGQRIQALEKEIKHLKGLEEATLKMWEAENAAKQATSEHTVVIKTKTAEQIKAEKAEKEAAAAVKKTEDSIREKIAEMEEQVKWLKAGKTAQEALTRAQLQSKGVSDDLIDEYIALNNQIEEFTEVAKKAEKASDPFADAWEEATKRIDEAFAEAWTGAFDSFKDFSERIEDAFKRLLAELAHQAITKKILINIGLGGSGSAMAGGPNLGTAQDAMSLLSGWGGNASGVSGLASIFGSAGSINTMLTSGMTSAVSGISSTLSSMGFEAAAGAFEAGAMDFYASMANAGGGNFAAGLAASAGAGIAGGYTGQQLGQGLFGKEAGSNWGAAAGAAFGAAVAGPIGAFVGGTIGGIVDSAFGSKVEWVKEQAGVDIQASGLGIEGQQWERFSKKKTWGGKKHKRVYSDIEEEMQMALNDAYAGTLGGIVAAFSGLGIDVTSEMVNSFETEVKRFNFKGGAEAFQEKFAEWLGDTSQEFADMISEMVGMEQMSVDRIVGLSTDLNSYNAIMKSFGREAKEISLAGAEAAQGLIATAGGLQALAMQTQAAYNFDTAFGLKDGLDPLRAILENVGFTFDEVKMAAEGGNMALGEMFSSLSDAEKAALLPFVGQIQGLIPAAVEAEEAQEALNEVTRDAASIAKEREALEMRLLKLQGDEEEIRRRQLEALDPSNRALQEQIWALEDAAEQEAELEKQRQESARATEEAARAEEAVNRERAGLLTEIMRLEGDTVGLRAQELEQLDPSNRALQERIWALEDAAEAERVAADVAREAAEEAERLAEEQARKEAEAAKAAQAIANERDALLQREMQVLGDVVGLRQLELDALDPSNRAILERIFALQDAQAAEEEAAAKNAELEEQKRREAEEATRLAEEAAAKAEQIANERYSLENRIFALLGDTAALRERELASLDPSNQALQERIYALEDAQEAEEKAAREAQQLAEEQARLAEEVARKAEEAARKAAQIANERYGLETQLLNLLGDTAQLRARELEQLDPSNRALQERIWLLQDQAAEEAARAEAEAERVRAAEEAAAEAARLEQEALAKKQAIADEAYGLETRLLTVMENTAELRRRELEQLDPSNRALQMRIWALEDEQAAAELAAREAEEAARADRAGRSAAAKAAEDAANKMKRLREEVGRVSDTLLEFVADLRGELAGGANQSASFLMNEFRSVASTASTGNLDAAQLLPQMGRDLIEAARRESTSAFDLNKTISFVANMTEDVARLLGGYSTAQVSNGLPTPQRAAVNIPGFRSQSTEMNMMAEEIRNLRNEIRDPMRSIAKHTYNTSENTRTMRDYNEQWDVEGLPPERV